MKIFLHLVSGDSSMHFRLKKDNSFRLYQNNEDDDDYFAMNEKDLDYIDIPEDLTFDGIVYSIDAADVFFNEMGTALSSTYFTKLDSHDYAIVPSYDQLVNCISQGIDELGNRLVLAVSGNFILANDYVKVPRVYTVLSYEFFVARNGYIGINAANDEHFMKDLYATGLAFYKKFLETGETGHFCDLFEPELEIENYKSTIADMLKAIKDSSDNS